MGARQPRDVGALVFARLRRRRTRHTDFNRVLQRFSAERFLYRLSASPEADSFTLKGATLFLVWCGDGLRGTRDVDLVRSEHISRGSLQRSLEAVCATPCPEDGTIFFPERVAITRVSAHPEQAGGAMRAKLRGTLGAVRLSLQVDVGFGDVITPPRQHMEVPTLLDHPRPKLWTYPRETMIAEKLHAMARFGPRHSRIKDVWDIAALAARFSFDGPILRLAVDRTLHHHGVVPTHDLPEPMTASFYGDQQQKLWSSFHRVTPVWAAEPSTLSAAAHMLRTFLEPVWTSAADAKPFDMVWPPGGPWRRRTDG